jgi:hypothetical protein
MRAGALEWQPADTGPLDGLDPALEGLAGLLDADAVAKRFPLDGPVEGQLARITYEPGRRAVAVYRLTTASRSPAARRTVGMVEVTPTASRHRLAVDDPALVGLAEAADGAAMIDRLAPLVAHPVVVCSAEPVSYRPGEHCVLRYDLWAEPAGGDQTTLFAKVYAAGATAVATTLADLHRCGRRSGAFSVAAPLAVVPELGLVVQAAAEGQSLGHRLFSPGSSARVRRAAAGAAGRALAALHGCAGPVGPVRSLAEEVEDLRRQARVVARVDAELGRGVDAVLDELDRRSAADAAPVPAHGSFRPDHVILDGTQVQLIDLDGYGWAEPTRDAGNLLAYLRWRALRDPRWAPAVADSRAGFLAGYAGADELDGERCALHEAVSAVKIVVRRFRRLAVSEWAVVPELVEAASALLRGRERVEVR